MATEQDKRAALVAIIGSLSLLVVVILMFESGQRPILLTLILIVLVGYTSKALWKLKTPSK